MIINLIGARGTVPNAKMATTSFLVDNKFLFECPSEIIQAFKRNQQDWAGNEGRIDKQQNGNRQ